MRKLDYGERDRVYTLLTRDHGKVGALAKGVRNSRSRLAPALELFSRVQVQLAHGRGSLDVVTQALRCPGPRLPAELERTAHASVVAEVADRVCEDRHPLAGIYELTVAALVELAREPQPRRALLWFESAALALLGYAPQLEACAFCRRSLPQLPAAFSPPAGGLLCPDCAQPGMRQVAVRTVKVLRLLAAGDLQLYRRLKLEEELLAEAEQVLEAQLEHHLDRQLRSLGFLRRLRAPAGAEVQVP